MGGAFEIIRQRVAGGLAQLAGSKPKWRTCSKPSGRTCGRNLQRHSRASRLVGRGRAWSGVREVKGTVRFVSETIRREEIAPVKTYGARYVRAEWECGGAWLWPFQGVVQPCGVLCSSRPAWLMSSFPRARERGERALTGTKKVALEGSQPQRSCDSPPPGTM
jgi:hypothetical protein